mmetsp:Transcript_28487/g.71479  ORF Transcript_28487/g.71479 Transcript_28487/m.71479 type:complete len:683 (+) Transcript_28487:403-2451(+)
MLQAFHDAVSAQPQRLHQLPHRLAPAVALLQDPQLALAPQNNAVLAAFLPPHKHLQPQHRTASIPRRLAPKHPPSHHKRFVIDRHLAAILVRPQRRPPRHHHVLEYHRVEPPVQERPQRLPRRLHDRLAPDVEARVEQHGEPGELREPRQQRVHPRVGLERQRLQPRRPVHVHHRGNHRALGRHHRRNKRHERRRAARVGFAQVRRRRTFLRSLRSRRTLARHTNGPPQLKVLGRALAHHHRRERPEHFSLLDLGVDSLHHRGAPRVGENRPAPQRARPKLGPSAEPPDDSALVEKLRGHLERLVAAEVFHHVHVVFKLLDALQHVGVRVVPAEVRAQQRERRLRRRRKVVEVVEAVHGAPDGDAFVARVRRDQDVVDAGAREDLGVEGAVEGDAAGETHGAGAGLGDDFVDEFGDDVLEIGLDAVRQGRVKVAVFRGVPRVDVLQRVEELPVDFEAVPDVALHDGVGESVARVGFQISRPRRQPHDLPARIPVAKDVGGDARVHRAHRFHVFEPVVVELRRRPLPSPSLEQPRQSHRSPVALKRIRRLRLPIPHPRLQHRRHLPKPRVLRQLRVADVRPPLPSHLRPRRLAHPVHDHNDALLGVHEGRDGPGVGEVVGDFDARGVEGGEGGGEGGGDGGRVGLAGGAEFAAGIDGGIGHGRKVRGEVVGEGEGRSARRLHS